MDASLTLDPATLPDDPALLKRLIVEERRQREQCLLRRERQLLADARALVALIKEEAAAHSSTLIRRIREEAVAQLAAQAERHAAELKAAIAAILRRYYGPRSESFDPRQLLLFGQVVEQMPLDEASLEEEAGEKLTTRRVKNRHNHGRQQLPESLERIEIEHDLAPEEKACPACGCERCRIGQEISEQLEYFPANFKVLKHVRHKYACRGSATPTATTRTSRPPRSASQPIDKGLAGPGLLAYVITSKLGDHSPLYRLENIFRRQRVEVARSTMWHWMAAAGELVKPLVALMIARIKRSRVVHTDDTTVPIQSPGEKQCRKGRIWCYLGDEANPYTVYDYTPNRKRDGPASWLRGFAGYLQADAYGGYDGIYSGGGVTEVACWRMRGGSSTMRRTPTAGGPRRCSRSSASCMPSSARRKTSRWMKRQRSRCAASEASHSLSESRRGSTPSAKSSCRAARWAKRLRMRRTSGPH